MDTLQTEKSLIMLNDDKSNSGEREISRTQLSTPLESLASMRGTQFSPYLRGTSTFTKFLFKNNR